MNQPQITILMPVRNEGAYIGRSLGSVLAQDYPPELLEVLVVDGQSDDGTRAAVTALAQARPEVCVRLLDNPRRTVPYAMNIGIRAAVGEVIVRVDGHCEIPRDYVRQCLQALESSGADCAGGVLETVGETATARTIALAMSSRFGVGSATFRTGTDTSGDVDTLAFGAYRREVFTRVGLFDEELTRNQDDEFNFRLHQAGGRLWLAPHIRVIYYSRASLGGLWRQYYEYGLYKVLVIRKRGAVAAARHLVPAALVVALLAAAVLALATGNAWWLAAGAGPYLLTNLAAAAWTARHRPAALPLLPLVFAVLHLSYGLGFLAGLWHWRGRGSR